MWQLFIVTVGVLFMAAQSSPGRFRAALIVYAVYVTTTLGYWAPIARLLVEHLPGTVLAAIAVLTFALVTWTSLGGSVVSRA